MPVDDAGGGDRLHAGDEADAENDEARDRDQDHERSRDAELREMRLRFGRRGAAELSAGSR
jgi:hypothetical protein